jgi:beta-glucanase (GH16 family)
LGAPQNDGKFHVYRWDWYDGTNGEARVEFYLDGRLLFTSTQNIPKSPARLWVGNWPAPWSGDFQYDTQHLYVDWVKITELR